MKRGPGHTKKRGLFITLEGPEGSGKTTLAKELYRVLRKKGYEVLLTYEPGGSSLGKVLRRALLQNKNHKISDLAELFLFEADRAQHVLEVILPALQQGKIVLCCRYCDSTTAYQGYGRGLDLDFVLSLNQRATKGLEADITLLLDLAPEQGLPRAFRARGSKDRLESEKLSFHRQLRRGYLDLAKKNPKRIRVISASRDFETVKTQSVAYISKKISSFGF
jgi:dTMP kinase